jgi:hypothetical protein
MLIGLNKDFDMPNNFAVTCHAPPSMFAYPQVEEKKEDEKKLVATAVLSTTARAKVREARKEARKLNNNSGLGSPSSKPNQVRSHEHPPPAAAPPLHVYFVCVRACVCVCVCVYARVCVCVHHCPLPLPCIAVVRTATRTRPATAPASNARRP